MFPRPGYGFKGMRELEDRKVGAVSPNDLDADRQRWVIARKTGGH
jgi:hypothetical protein